MCTRKLESGLAPALSGRIPQAGAHLELCCVRLCTRLEWEPAHCSGDVKPSRGAGLGRSSRAPAQSPTINLSLLLPLHGYPGWLGSSRGPVAAEPLLRCQKWPENVARTRFEPVGSASCFARAQSPGFRSSKTPSRQNFFCGSSVRAPRNLPLHPDHPAVTYCAMAAPNTTMPTWQQTALEKRRVRDEAIQKFLDTHAVRPSPPHHQPRRLATAFQGSNVKLQRGQDDISDAANAATTETDNVDSILQAIRSSAVTATGLTTAYIRRCVLAPLLPFSIE